MARGPEFHAAVIGGGPGGIAPFVAADRVPALGQEFMGRGVLLVDGGNPKFLGQGGVRNYRIESNSAANEFVIGVHPGRNYRTVRNGSRARALEHAGDKTVHLASKVSPFLGELGRQTAYTLTETPRSRLLTATRVPRLQLHGDDRGPYWGLLDAAGQEVATARNVVLAPGSHEQPLEHLQKFGAELVLSGDIINERRVGEIESRMSRGETAVFVGASHSGLAGAEKLKNAGEITIVHRGPLRRYFPSEAAAKEAGYPYEPGDVCEVTNRINRYGGVRGVAGEFAAQVESGEYPNVRFLQVGDLSEAEEVLIGAGMIVQSTGYQANVVEAFAGDEKLGPIVDGRGQVVVDVFTRVHGHDGAVLPNLFGIGLGHGVPPSKEHGGEASFKGRTDSINLFQGSVAERVLTGVLI